MKECETYLPLMMLVLDGEASQEEVQALHAHLEECEACRMRYESYLAVDEAIKRTEEEPPEQLTAAIMNGICQEKPRVGHWLHRYRFTAIAAVAALVVLVGARVTWNTPSGKSSAAADHMENAAAAEMEVAEDALEPQEVPQMAAFQEAPAEPAAEVAAEEPALQPAENPDGGQNFGADASLKEETVYSSEENAPSFPECIKALQEAGYSGHVMYLTDVSREKLEQVVPDMREIALEDGLVAYEIGESDAAVVQTRFPVSEDRVSGTDSEEHYFIFLVS